MAANKSTAKKKKTTASSSGRKKTGSQSASGSRSKKTVAELAAREREQKNQMWAIVLFALGILLTALALIAGGSGWLMLHNLLRGLLGPISYAVGPLTVGLAVILTLGKEKLSAGNKVGQTMFLLVLLCGVSQLFYGLPEGEGFFSKLFSFYTNGVFLKSGGLLAAVLGWPLMRFAGGTFGAAVIQLLLVFVFLMLISGSTLMGFFRTCAHPVRQLEKSYTAHRERREEEISEEPEERPIKRRSRIDIDLGGETAQVATAENVSGEDLQAFRISARELRRRQREADKLGMKIDPVTGELLEKEPEPSRPKYRLDADYLWGAPVTEAVKARKAAAEKEEAPLPPVTVSAIRPDPKPGQAVFTGENSGRKKIFSLEEPLGLDSADFADLGEEALSVTEDTPAPEDTGEVQRNGSSFLNKVKAFIGPDGDTYEEEGEMIGPEEETYVDTAAFDEVKKSVLDGARPSEDAFGALSLGRAGGEQQDDRSLERALGEAERPVVQEKPDSLVPEVRFGGGEEEIYQTPPISLLKAPKKEDNSAATEELEANAVKLVETLKSFGVQTRVIAYSRGPTVTRYELQPLAGVKISKITGLSDDIALNLATAGVRIEAPIPNKPAVGIEVPNKITDSVTIREIIDSEEFRNAKGTLPIALGKDIAGNPAIGDVAAMPHVLIAGTTGSGKSVCVNSMIISILYKSAPKDVRFIMIDPKVVEMGIYNGIPHLLIPVVTDPKKAAGALNWAVSEMLKRYAAFAENSVRDIKGYNRLAEKSGELEHMPHVVIVIDELADLMMAAPNEVEDAICRLAQMARAAGMHLIIATQRPSVDVVTGLIKANVPSRIALSVSSQVDSRTILDTGGAEKLLGRGDMLYAPMGFPKPVRVQGCYVSDGEIEAVVDFLKNGREPVAYDAGILDEIERQAAMESGKKKGGAAAEADSAADDLFEDAVQCVLDAGQCSTSYLQRRLKVGYARAARLVDELENRGIVGPPDGSKPREVLITKNQWAEYQLRNSP